MIRLRVEAGGGTLSLDTFNRADTPPPAVGTETEVSFAASDVILLAD